ncbi:hypothetical protein Tco_0295384 [Tanacetum coccineum]
MIDQGVTAALAARDANRNTNGDDSYNSGTGGRRTERTACECTYTDFLKCQPLNFKGMEGVPVIPKASNLQTELERTKERFENCIIKKENNYAKLWNDWYKKCEECKYDKISYDKAYNDIQQKIERLQAQLGDQKGKSKDTPYVSNTLDPLSQKLENENDTTHGTSTNTKFAKQSILGKPPSSSRPKLYVVTPLPKSKAIPKIDESHALSKLVTSKNDLSNPVTSNSVPTTTESKVVTNDKVIAPGMFRINPFKTSMEDKFVPINKVRASVRTN